MIIVIHCWIFDYYNFCFTSLKVIFNFYTPNISILLQLKSLQKRNVQPYDPIFAAISIKCSKELKVDLAESYLDQMSCRSVVYPYNSCLEACKILVILLLLFAVLHWVCVKLFRFTSHDKQSNSTNKCRNWTRMQWFNVTE